MSLESPVAACRAMFCHVMPCRGVPSETPGHLSVLAHFPPSAFCSQEAAMSSTQTLEIRQSRVHAEFAAPNKPTQQVAGDR